MQVWVCSAPCGSGSDCRGGGPLWPRRKTTCTISKDAKLFKKKNTHHDLSLKSASVQCFLITARQRWWKRWALRSRTWPLKQGWSSWTAPGLRSQMSTGSHYTWLMTLQGAKVQSGVFSGEPICAWDHYTVHSSSTSCKQLPLVSQVQKVNQAEQGYI